MSEICVYQVAEIRLKNTANDLCSYRSVVIAREYLNNGRVAGRIQAVIGTRDEAIKKCRELVAKDIQALTEHPLNIPLSQFEFQVNFAEVVDGVFWSGLHVRLCHNFDVEEK